MKPSSSKSPTTVQVLLLVMTLLVLPCCKSPSVVTQDNATQHYTTLHNHSHDTVVLRDSIYIKEILRGDTVYLTRVEYRDRWRTRLVHDTIRDTQYITKTIEHPPEKYIPKFHKVCTAILCILVLLFIVYFILKHRYPLNR